jgi:hypothetical protein
MWSSVANAAASLVIRKFMGNIFMGIMFSIMVRAGEPLWLRVSYS